MRARRRRFFVHGLLCLHDSVDSTTNTAVVLRRRELWQRHAARWRRGAAPPELRHWHVRLEWRRGVAVVAALVLKRRGFRVGDSRVRVLLAERRCQGLGAQAAMWQQARLHADGRRRGRDVVAFIRRGDGAEDLCE